LLGSEPDFRKAIADSWPASIDDSAARRDWGWAPAYDLQALVDDMLGQLQRVLGAQALDSGPTGL
jgi:hypothetical protein